MISISFNNEPMSIPQNISLTELLIQQGYTENHYAVALNRHFVPRMQQSSTLLQESDAVVIVSPMQGG